MSRSNPSDHLQNPAIMFFDWNATDGGFSYYDKEKKEKIKISYPFKFMPLDVCYTFKGFSDSAQSNFWSNECKLSDAQKTRFTVRSKRGIEVIGNKAECKAKLEADGLKGSLSVYIAYRHEGKLVLANVNFKGAAMKPWIEFSKLNKVMDIAIQVDSHTDEKKGSVKYLAPVFKAIKNLPQEALDGALALDRELQAYLTAYFARQSDAKVEQPIDKPEHNNAHVDEPKAAVANSAPATVDSVDLSDESDLPF
jgi:hypothetical protein